MTRLAEHELLHAIARHNSLEKAARSLSISANAVRKRLRLMESSVGARLYFRYTAPGERVLTPAGEILAEAATVALVANRRYDEAAEFVGRKFPRLDDAVSLEDRGSDTLPSLTVDRLGRRVTSR